jgi:hypothetical protein
MTTEVALDPALDWEDPSLSQILPIPNITPVVRHTAWFVLSSLGAAITFVALLLWLHT